MSARDDDRPREQTRELFSFLADQKARSLLHTYFKRSPRSEVEDLVQRTLLAALQSAQRHRDSSRTEDAREAPRDAKAFVLGVARHTLYARLRERRREVDLDALTLEQRTVARVDDSSEDDVLKAIEQALLQLPSELHEIVRLRYFERRTQADIAETLGLAAGTVASRLRRARALLRERLAHTNNSSSPRKILVVKSARIVS